MLFPFGQRTYELGIPLKKVENNSNPTNNDDSNQSAEEDISGNEDDEPIVSDVKRTKVRNNVFTLFKNNTFRKKVPTNSCHLGNFIDI